MLVICDGGKKSGILYGSYKLYDDDATLLTHRQLVFGDGTSNQAEYLTLLYAIRHAKKFSPVVVVVHTDSELMAKQLNGYANCHAGHLRIIKEQIEREMKAFESFEIKKVARNIIRNHLGH